MIQMGQGNIFSESDLCQDPSKAEQVAQWLEDLEDLDECGAKFTPRQREFLSDMDHKVRTQGKAASFSEKQFNWIKGLWESHS